MKKVLSLTLALAFLTFSVNSAQALEISGNGVKSLNFSKLSTKIGSRTTQNNTSFISNNLLSSSLTGDNKAKENTGGTTEVTSGDALSEVGLLNTANVNTVVEPTDCTCSCTETPAVAITDNGNRSKNFAFAKTSCLHALKQNNRATLKNSIFSGADTGGNSAGSNTGGDVEVTSGEALSSVVVENTANSNSNGL